MSLVEQRYRYHISQMTGTQRVVRSAELLCEIASMIEFQIKKQDSSLTPRELRRRLMQQLYASDPQTLALLNKMTV